MSLELYEELTRGISPDTKIKASSQGTWWTCVTGDDGAGMAMTYGTGLEEGWSNPEGLGLQEVAHWIFDWDPRRCSYAMAAINAHWNRRARVEQNFGASADFGSVGSEFMIELVTARLAEGQVVVSVGHFPFLDRITHENLYILEKKQQKRDLPDTACEEMLPRADTALITGSSLVNKSFPRLAKLARDAETYLLGPSTPLYPGLSQYGINKFIGAGVIEEPGVIQSMVRNGAGGEVFSSEALSLVKIELGA